MDGAERTLRLKSIGDTPGDIMSSFRIRGLEAEQFRDLFALTDAQLADRHARRIVVDGPGYPCRVSLTDATPGDSVILVSYEHHRTDSPFRASMAIYVREGERTFDAIDTVPAQLRKRLLSLRGYDAAGMLRQAEVMEGREIEAGIDKVFADPKVAYIHTHFAKPGCYAALIERH